MHTWFHSVYFFSLHYWMEEVYSVQYSCFLCYRLFTRFVLMSYGLHFGETKIMRLLKKNWTGTVATRLTHYSLHVWSCWTSCVLNNFLNAMQYFRILRSETFNPAIRIKNAPDEGLWTLNYVYRLVAHVKLSLWCRLFNSQILLFLVACKPHIHVWNLWNSDLL